METGPPNNADYRTFASRSRQAKRPRQERESPVKGSGGHATDATKSAVSRGSDWFALEGRSRTPYSLPVRRGLPGGSLFLRRRLDDTVS